MNTLLELAALPELRAIRDPYLMAIYLGPLLVENAREAAKYEAENYRDFLVGCATFATDETRLGLFAAGNFYPVKGGPKVCAEKPVLESVRAAGFAAITFSVTSGEVQTDSGGLELPHLPHCDSCTDMMADAPEIDDDTISMFVRDSRDEYGLYTQRDLKILKASVDSPNAPTFFDHHVDPGLMKWRAGVDLYRQYADGHGPANSPFKSVDRGPVLMKLAVTGALQTT